MANTLYGLMSPWYTTNENQNYLEELTIRPVPASDTDQDYVIETHYRHRPDLLAFDIYGDSKLWWVLVQRNIDIIKDPIFDFEPGVSIKLPNKIALLTSLGI